MEYKHGASASPTGPAPQGAEPIFVVSGKAASPLRGLRALWRNFQIVRALRKRGWKRETDWILVRKRDGRMFAAGSPQNFAYAMSGLFDRSRKDHFHFYRVREWHGILVASPKVIWRPVSGEFDFLFKASRFDLPKWPESVECRKLDELIA